MSGFGLHAALDSALKENRESIDSMRAAGIAKAEKDAAYRSALSVQMALLKANGMPSTHLKDMARGDKKVNRALLEAELADAEYEACKEKVMLCKREVDIIREQIQREFTQAGWR